MPKAKSNTSSSTSSSGNPASNSLTKKDVETADKVVKKLTGKPPEPVGKGKIANLPLVSAVYADNEDMNRAIELLKQGHELADQIKELEPKLKEIKDDITGVVLGAEVPGYRYGSLAVSVNMVEGRKSLNKDRLRQVMVERGIDPITVGEIIEESIVAGDPYYTVRLDKVS